MEMEVLEEGRQWARRRLESKLQARAEARKRKDFATADRIRQELLARGVIVEDTKEGVRWKLK